MNDPDLLAELGELMDEAGTDTLAAAPQANAQASVTNELAQLQASMGVIPALISVCLLSVCLCLCVSFLCPCLLTHVGPWVAGARGGCGKCGGHRRRLRRPHPCRGTRGTVRRDGCRSSSRTTSRIGPLKWVEQCRIRRGDRTAYTGPRRCENARRPGHDIKDRGAHRKAAERQGGEFPSRGWCCCSACSGSRGSSSSTRSTLHGLLTSRSRFC